MSLTLTNSKLGRRVESMSSVLRRLLSRVSGDANTLIRSLQNPALYDHEVEEFTVIETHISWVLLTGPYAYKIKKPVDLGFADFSTLEKRRFYCHEELRLNRRLAPHHYIDVISITGAPERPVLNGTDPILEYAVKMVQFSRDAQLDRVLARGALKNHHIDQLAQKLATFHNNVEIAGPETSYGKPTWVQELVNANFDRVLSVMHSQTDTDRLIKVRTWAEQEYDRQQETLWLRKQKGFVRECHGDMHLANIALVDDGLLIFDCIEFNDDLRWIDVMSEAAFVVMDLAGRGHPELARRFLNAYVENTGDYAGLGGLRYYLTYRAMVRAMVDSIRAGQPGLDEREKQKVLVGSRSYIALAERYTQPPQPALIITHGVSGSGKTTVAQSLLENQPFAIRIRSDVERKRLYGLAPNVRTRSETNGGLYTEEDTDRTYTRLADLTRSLLESGFTAIVDAAFLKRAQRDTFRALAKRLKALFIIFDCQPSEDTLLNRVLNREREGRDASEANAAVLTHQLATHEPLTEAEKGYAVVIDTTHGVDGTNIAAALPRPVLQR